MSQTLFQREVWFSDERFQDFYDHHAGGHRKPIELCPTKLSMVSSGYQGWSPWRTCICETVDKPFFYRVSQHQDQEPFPTYHFHCIRLVLFRSFLFSFFNCSTRSEPSFLTLVLCLKLLLTEYKLSRCFFLPAWNTWLMASYKRSLWYTCNTRKNVKQLSRLRDLSSVSVLVLQLHSNFKCEVAIK